MPSKSDFEGKGSVPMQLPYGENRHDIRNSFLWHTGDSAEVLFDSDVNREAPSEDEIQELFVKMSEDEVLILLGSNAYTFENELVAYIIFNTEGWNYLLYKGWVYPKVLKRVKWISVQFMVSTNL